MVNTRTKGNRAVRELITKYEEAGWLCEVVEKCGKFVKQKDLFGLWDVMCIHPKNRPMLIQVTCNRYHYPLKPYHDFAACYRMFKCVLYKRIDGKRNWNDRWQVKVL